MTSRSLVAAMAACSIVGAAANAQMLQTEPPNNGSGGVFLELENISGGGETLLIDQFDFGGFTGTTGTQVEVEIWIRDGSYSGFEQDPSGWDFVESHTVTRQGSTSPVEMPLDDEIEIEDGETISVYLQALDSGGIRYTGRSTDPPQTTWTTGELRLFSDVATTASTAFTTGSLFSPRCFSGVIYYSMGEPDCIADWNGDGVVNINDFFAYLSDFEAGDPRADLTGSGTVNINDFFMYLSEFEAGC